MCEVKYYNNKLSAKIIQEEILKIKEIGELSKIDIGLVSCNGFEKDNVMYLTVEVIYKIK